MNPLIGQLLSLGLKLLPFLRWKRKRCILIVEDDPRDAELTAAKIARLGWQCDIVTSAEGAYPLLLSRAHSVVLLDIRLPYESGVHLASRIVKTAPWAHVVLMPGIAEDLASIPCSVYFGLIAKPITEESLKHVFEKPRP